MTTNECYLLGGLLLWAFFQFVFVPMAYWLARQDTPRRDAMFFAAKLSFVCTEMLALLVAAAVGCGVF